MTTLYAQPFDITAFGFNFDSHASFVKKSARLRNDYGDPVEEFSIELIDGEDIDCELAKAWGVTQVHLSSFFEAVDEWNKHQKRVFIIAFGECGCSFDPASDHPDQFEVDIYEMDSLLELAEHFLDEGFYGEIPKPLQYYIDHHAIARDLSLEYAEISIAGTSLVYACR